MTLDPQQVPDVDQAEMWNGGAGRAWVKLQDLLDGMFAPFERLLVAEAAESGARRVLDVGCGTGATTVAIARELGASASSVGADLSAPMIEAARERSARERVAASFVVADAQTHAFPAPDFDLIVSRFGVMFFPDPVAAFANLRRAAAADGQLCAFVWRGPEDNPFMTASGKAVSSLIEIPARVPDMPGPFGLADRDRAADLLGQAGWTSIEITPVDVACTLLERDLVRYFTRIGPLAPVLHEADPDLRPVLLERARAGFEPFVDGDHVRFTGACWRIAARA